MELLPLSYGVLTSRLKPVLENVSGSGAAMKTLGTVSVWLLVLAASSHGIQRGMWCFPLFKGQRLKILF